MPISLSQSIEYIASTGRLEYFLVGSMMGEDHLETSTARVGLNDTPRMAWLGNTPWMG